MRQEASSSDSDVHRYVIIENLLGPIFNVKWGNKIATPQILSNIQYHVLDCKAVKYGKSLPTLRRHPEDVENIYLPNI
jgi:hypothetical protein